MNNLYISLAIYLIFYYVFIYFICLFFLFIDFSQHDLYKLWDKKAKVLF